MEKVKGIIELKRKWSVRWWLLFLAGIVVSIILPKELVYAKEPDRPKNVRVGYFYDKVFHEGQSDEEMKRGYGYEYYQMISNYTSWEYEYVYGTWAEIYQKFLDGEIDIIDDLSITPDREEQMLFSTLPMGTENVYIFVKNDDRELRASNLSALNGRAIAVDRNSLDEALLHKFIEENRLDCRVVPVSGVEERMQLLNTGAIDGMAGADGLAVEGVRPTIRLAATDVYFAVNKERMDLLMDLDAALLKIFEQNPSYNDQLREKYFRSGRTRDYFTSPEKEWLRQNPVLTIGYRKHNLPLADYDEKKDIVTGLLADVSMMLSEKMQVEFRMVPFESTEEMEQALQNGEVDGIFPVVDNVWYAEKKDYKQTFAITEQQMALIFKGNYPGLSGYQRFGYVEGNPEQFLFLQEHNPAVECVKYADAFSMMEAIRLGEIDCALMSSYSWDYLSNRYLEYEQLNSVLLKDMVGYSFAVSGDNARLYGILETAVGQLDERVIAELVNHYTLVQDDYSIVSFVRHHLLLSFLILVVGFSVVIIGVAFFMRMQMQKQYLTYTSEHDALTGVYNRVAFSRLTESFVGHQMNLAVVIIDIDDFKQINDTYGHEVGDQVIRIVAREISMVVRQNDSIIRYGGDEFIILMSGVTMKDGDAIANRIIRLLGSLQALDNNLPRVTVSAGIAFSEGGYSTELFANADKALYTTKRNGRKGYTIAEKIYGV